MLKNKAPNQQSELRRMVVAEIPHLSRYAVSLTQDRVSAEDLLQSCLERTLSRLDQFQPGTDLRRWLFTIMRNLHIDNCRAARRRGPHVRLEDGYCERHYPASQEHRLRIREVQSRLSRLRACDRQILLLSTFSRVSPQTIARRMNVAVGTVRSRLSRARSELAA